MKNFFLLSGIAVMAVLIIFSCKKSSESLDNTKPISNACSSAEMKVLNFLSYVDNALKDERVYSTDSAIWYAEAALNYTYAIYDSSYAYLLSDTNEFSFDLDQNNEVTQTELEAVYAEMEDALENYNTAIQDNVKHVFLCDVEEVDISGGELIVTLVSIFACGSSNYQWSYFEEDDYWYSILHAGNCYYMTGNDDAAIKLNEAYNSLFSVSDPSVRVWFSNQQTVYEVDPHDYDYGPAPRGYRGFYHYGSGIHVYLQCVPPEELEFYMTSNGLEYIIDDNIPASPPDMEFEYLDISSDGLMAGDEFWIEDHIMNITYGVKHETTVPASGL